MSIIEQIRAEVERLKETAKLMKLSTYKSGWISAMNAVLQLLSTLQEQAVCHYGDTPSEERCRYCSASCDARVTGQPICEDAYIKRLHEKRILPTLKGEIKHKFRNEYNTILQTLGLIPLLSPYDVARKRLEEMCLAFAAWGFYNLHLERCEHYPDNPVCEELEEEVKNHFQGYLPGTETAEQCNTDLHFTPPAIIRLARHFAQWQKEQMMKEAVEGHIATNGMGNKYIFPNYNDDFKEVNVGDKVRIIIVKED